MKVTSSKWPRCTTDSWKSSSASSTEYRDFAMPCTLVALMKIVIRGCMARGERAGVGVPGASDLETYLSLCNFNVACPPSDRERDSVRWREEQRLNVLQFSGKIILHVAKGIHIPFAWAQQLVGAAVNPYEFALNTPHVSHLENIAVFYILIAAMVPPSDDLQCKSRYFAFLNKL